jgi:hypothetical protein
VDNSLPKPLTALQCRERAAECRRKAGETKDPEIRRMLGDVAEQWTFCADQRDRIEKRGKMP